MYADDVRLSFQPKDESSHSSLQANLDSFYNWCGAKPIESKQLQMQVVLHSAKQL